MEQVHRIVHVIEFEHLAGEQINAEQPVNPDAELGVGLAEQVGGHGQKGAFVIDPQTLFLDDIGRCLFNPDLFPQYLDHQLTTVELGLTDLQITAKARSILLPVLKRRVDS